MVTINHFKSCSWPVKLWLLYNLMYWLSGYCRVNMVNQNTCDFCNYYFLCKQLELGNIYIFLAIIDKLNVISIHSLRRNHALPAFMACLNDTFLQFDVSNLYLLPFYATSYVTWGKHATRGNRRLNITEKTWIVHQMVRWWSHTLTSCCVDNT